MNRRAKYAPGRIADEDGYIYFYWPEHPLAMSGGVWEHRLVRAHDLSKLGIAFFNMNGFISVIYLVTILAAVLLRHGVGS